MPLVETIKGRRWFWSAEGKGQPLIFIHGWSADGRIWLQQQKYFSQKFRVATVDLPGHGQTPWQDLSLAEMAEDIVDMMRSQQMERPVIVGSSLGGLVGLKIYELFPEGVRAMVFVGSQPKFLQTSDYPWGLAPERISKLRHQLETDYPAIVPIFFRSLFTSAERSSERFKWLQSFRRNENVPSREALAGVLTVLLDADLREVLHSMKIPLQFINGTDDPLCPKELYFELKTKLPKARWDWLTGCGHFPFVSRPDEFNTFLENFLEGLDG